MSRGREARLTAMMLACVAFMAVLAGCHAPLQRPAPTEATASRSYPASAPAEMPALQPVPETWTQTSIAQAADQGISRETLSGPLAAKPTPLLDAALKHAAAVDQARQEAAPVSNSTASAGTPGHTDAPIIVAAAATTKPAKDDKGPAPAPAPKPAAGQPAASGPPVRAQVVEWLAIEAAKPENRAMVQRAATTIADAIKTSAKDQSGRSTDLRSVAMALEDRGPLGIADLRLCRKVNGFGSYEPMSASALKPGQPFLLYGVLNGLRLQPKDTSFVSRLSGRIELIAPGDSKAIWEQSLGEAEDECRSRRRDNYVNYRVALPRSVPAGDYRLRLTQTDLIANHSVSSEIPVTVTR